MRICIKTTLLNFLICVSLANLIMMKAWLQLLPFDNGKCFWLPYSPSNSYLAAMINTILIGFGLWCITFIFYHMKWPSVVLWAFIFGTTLCFALVGIRDNYSWGMHNLYLSFGEYGALLVCFAVFFIIIGMIFWIVRNRYQVARQCYRVPMLLVPFVLVTFGQSLIALQKVEPNFTPHILPEIHHTNNTLTMPVVWVIFDELDYGITFGRRPQDLILPEFDRLRQSSLFVTHAFSPSTGTPISIPALLTGKSLKTTKPLSKSEMQLTGVDGTDFSLNNEATIFADVHNRGGKTALFGWFFPYSRLFSSVGVNKYYPDFFYPTSEQLGKTMLMQLRTLVESGYFSIFGESLAASNHIAITKSMNNDVKNHLQINQNSFTFLHYPIPHALNIYNRHDKKFGSNRNIKEGYLDNVALADLLLGEIRATMQKTGLWDKSLFIVSSDHHWRYNTYDGIVDKRRVPFIVKLPGQTKGLLVPDRFETVNTRQMILNVVDGRIGSPEAMKKWIQKLNSIHRSDTIN